MLWICWGSNDSIMWTKIVWLQTCIKNSYDWCNKASLSILPSFGLCCNVDARLSLFGSSSSMIVRTGSAGASSLRNTQAHTMIISYPSCMTPSISFEVSSDLSLSENFGCVMVLVASSSNAFLLLDSELLEDPTISMMNWISWSNLLLFPAIWRSIDGWRFELTDSLACWSVSSFKSSPARKLLNDP
ncbi:hypothetical protein OGAPHI_004602 [Ogataea philodendri]|uniref:Uncharacterized protein n=1 Tax=Ogataea philodendri TaxID=1378263 RepID=A0A9P8T3Q7_9ASCO|nr:uncharacterized protein OGAPHI_004602 [Ogataea philodendri]KAH3664250.1 hypothetical protein OGAPHI_004602 [Ogataea philodendri]